MCMRPKSDVPESVEQSYLRFAREVLLRISGWAQIQPIEQRPEVRYEWAGNCVHEQRMVRANYAALIDRHRCDLRELAATAAECLSQLATESIMPAVEESDADCSSSEFRMDSMNELLYPVLRAVTQHSSLSLTDEDIATELRDFLSRRTADHIFEENGLILRNFTSDTQVELPSGVLIAPFTPARKADLFNKHMVWMDGFSQWDFAYTSFMLTLWSARGRDDPISIEDEVVKRAEYAITALRLLKAGCVGATHMLHFHEWPLYHTSFMTRPMWDYGVPIHPPWYHLTESDLPGLCQLYETLSLLHSRRQLHDLDVCIRRFNSSYGRDKDEDRIIDLAIALESSLLHGDSNPQLKYRQALRGAALLADTHDPLATNRQLETMYDIRSKIVHEGKSLRDDKLKKQIEKLDTSDFPDVCEELVRCVLRAYIQRIADGKTVSDINRELDSRIIGGLRSLDSANQTP